MKTRTMPEIEMVVESSILLCVLMALLTSVGLWVVIVYVPDWRLQLLLMLWLLVTTYYYVLRDGLRRLPKSWKHLHISAHGELRLTNQAGETFTPVFSGDTWIHPWLIVLNFKHNRDSRIWQTGLPPLVLVARTDIDCYRRLRVWLRWWRHADLHPAGSEKISA
ncbi:MAG TPA: hypothetical protein PLR90_00945 [Methylophilus sp.]|nr:hypothetical protein [Methylophilus sp.]HQQ32456.1 hypothetical protein [Methylophilus sp.]